MKLNLIGRATTATILSLAMAFGATGCTVDYTVAFVYAPSAKTSVINQYGVDYQSGSLSPLATPTISSGGTNPVAAILAPNQLALYVLNHDSNSVAAFSINSDGTLAAGKVTTLSGGTTPTAGAITSDGKFLYVTYQYQTGFSATTPGPGGVAIFSVGSDGSLTAAGNVPVGRTPVGVATSNFNHFVYVIDQDLSVTNNLLGFSQNATTGALTPLAGVTINPGNVASTGYPSGIAPSAIAEEPTSRFLYVTDRAQNHLIAYVLNNAGVPTAMQGGPFPTDQFPVGLTIDPRGKFLYTVNYSAGTLGAYVIDPATGAPSGSVGSGAVHVGTGPTCVTIEPALGIYLFTSNSLDNSISGEQLDPHNGGLKTVQNTPFNTAGQPTCAVAAANGTHASQVVQP